MPLTRPQTVTDIFENDEDTDRTYQMRSLNELLGQQTVDYSRFKMDAPQAPQQDTEMMQRYQRLARIGAIGQAVDAVGNAIGVAANQNWQPATSPVGQMGVESLNRIRELDSDYRNRLDRHREEVFRTDRHNQQLDIRDEEQKIRNEQTKIQNDIRNLRLQYEQGQLNDREFARAITGIQRDYIRQGFNWDPNTGRLTPLPGSRASEAAQGEMIGDPGQMSEFEQQLQLFGIGPRETQLYQILDGLRGEITEDMRDPVTNEALPGTPAETYDRLKKSLGDNYYILDSIIRSSMGRQQPTSYDPMTDPQTQRNRQGANRTTMQALVQNVIDAPDEQTREQAGAYFIQVAERYIRENLDEFAQYGVTEDNVDEAVKALYQELLQQQSGQNERVIDDRLNRAGFRGEPAPQRPVE